jgi:hypothetical protein
MVRICQPEPRFVNKNTKNGGLTPFFSFLCGVWPFAALTRRWPKLFCFS